MLKITAVIVSMLYFVSNVQCYVYCDLEGVTMNQWASWYAMPKMLDTFEGIVASFKTTNVHNAWIHNNKYLTASYENNIITISTTEEFKSYEIYEKNTVASLFRLDAHLYIECDEGQSLLKFRQPLIDTNNHTPFFSQESYGHTVNDLVKAGDELQKGIEILATDHDCLNNRISIWMEENEFLEAAEGQYYDEMRKSWYAAVRAKVNIAAPFERQFKLFATDVGQPDTRTTFVTYTLRVI